MRLTPSKWAEARALWETGDTSLAELQELFSLSPRAFQSHFAKHGVVKGAKAAAMAKKIECEVFATAFPDHDGWVDRARDTRDSTYRNAVVIGDLVMAQLQVAQEDPTQALRVASSIKALSLAAATLERTHALRWAALGLAKDSVVGEQLPELIFRDLGAAEIEAFQQRDADEDDDLGGNMGSVDPFTQEDAVDEGDPRDDDDVVIEGDESPAPLPAKGKFDADGCKYVREVH